MLKYIGRFVSGSGALLVLLFFFLPWILVSCGGQPMGTMSGWELAAGTSLGGEHVDGNPVVFAFLVIAILALAIAIALRHSIAFAAVEVFLGIGAIIFLLILYMQMRQEVMQELGGLIRLTPKAGLIGSLIGFFFIATGGAIEGGIYAFMRASPGTAPKPQPAAKPAASPPPRDDRHFLDALDDFMGSPAPPKPRPKPKPQRAASRPAPAAAAFPQEGDDDHTALDGAPAESAPIARLIVQNGQWRSRRLLVESDNVLIGRGSHCQICLPDKFVSRRHARLRYAQGQWFIQDQNSTGGTFVNGQRIHATRLNDGDIIRVGKTELRFQLK